MSPDEGARPKYTVLLTACITPKVGVREGLKRVDPELRKQDYVNGLRFWLNLESDLLGGIVFAENSGYPLDGIRESLGDPSALKREVEFLSFDDPPTPAGLNYGYSEFALIGEALRASRLMATTPYFVKATGRYTFPSVLRLLRRLPADFLVAVDSRGPLPFGVKRIALTTVALAVFSRRFFGEELMGLHNTMVPAPPWTRKQFVENVLYDALLPHRGDSRYILRWPCNCDPVGVGSNGDVYNTPRKRIQGLVRTISRWATPNLWI